jgi:hypothetical protein
MEKYDMQKGLRANRGENRTEVSLETPAQAAFPAEGSTGGASPPTPPAHGNRKILVVSREPGFSEAVVDYAVNLAERLGYDLIAMNVGLDETPAGMMTSPYRRYLQGKFRRQAKAAVSPIEAAARRMGRGFEHLVRFGHLSDAVEALNQEKRRIEFVLNASETSEAEMAVGVTLPVFTIKGDQGGRIMGSGLNRGGWHLSVKTLGWGVATAALYAAVFSNTSSIMGYFTRGGWYAALPLATVFVFSFVHGAFSHHVWEMLGIRAPRTTAQPRPTAAKRPARRPRPRLRLNV